MLIPVYDFVNFETNLSFLIQLFFCITKKSGQKLSEKQKELLRWNKNHFLSLLKSFQLPESLSDLRVGLQACFDDLILVKIFFTFLHRGGNKYVACCSFPLSWTRDDKRFFWSQNKLFYHYFLIYIWECVSHFSLIIHFYTPWKRQKAFSKRLFRGYRNGALDRNGSIY